MKHTKGVITPLSRTTPETSVEKTPDRSNLADLYPHASQPDGYLEHVAGGDNYQPIFAIKTLIWCALLLPLPYVVVIFGIDFFIKSTNDGNVFVHLPLIVLGLLFSTTFIYVSAKHVIKKLELLRFNVSAYLILYLLCLAPLFGAIFGVSHTATYAAIILSAGLLCASLLLFLVTGFILSKPSSKNHAKSAYLITMLGICFSTQVVYIAFKLINP